MCDLVSAGMLAVSAISSGMQAQQQRKMAEKQNDAVENAARVQQAQLTVQQEQQNKAAAGQAALIAERARAQRAGIATIAGESSASGNYLTRAFGESQMAEGNALTNLEINREGTMLQGFNQGNAMAANANMSMAAKQSYSTVLLDTALKGLTVYGGGIKDSLFPKAPATTPSIFGSNTASVPRVSASYWDPNALNSMGLTNDPISYAPWRN